MHLYRHAAIFNKHNYYVYILTGAGYMYLVSPEEQTKTKYPVGTDLHVMMQIIIKKKQAFTNKL